MNEKDNKQGLQIELTPDVAQGEYANFAIITHSSSDFVIDFARVLPGSGEEPCHPRSGACQASAGSPAGEHHAL